MPRPLRLLALNPFALWAVGGVAAELYLVAFNAEAWSAAILTVGAGLAAAIVRVAPSIAKAITDLTPPIIKFCGDWNEMRNRTARQVTTNTASIDQLRAELDSTKEQLRRAEAELKNAQAMGEQATSDQLGRIEGRVEELAGGKP